MAKNSVSNGAVPCIGGDAIPSPDSCHLRLSPAESPAARHLDHGAELALLEIVQQDFVAAKLHIEFEVDEACTRVQAKSLTEQLALRASRP